MKTFKLKMLHVLHEEQFKAIPLIDGLIINREDESNENQWLIEAYVEKDYIDFFEKLKGETRLNLKVKISKDDNDPVEVISSIININDIGKNINVLFKGDIKRVR